MENILSSKENGTKIYSHLLKYITKN